MKRRNGKRKKIWEDDIKKWTGMDFPARLHNTGQLKTGQEEKGLLRCHLLCHNELAMLWIGWLVGLGFNGPFRQYFSLYRVLS